MFHTCILIGKCTNSCKDWLLNNLTKENICEFQLRVSQRCRINPELKSAIPPSRIDPCEQPGHGRKQLALDSGPGVSCGVTAQSRSRFLAFTWPFLLSPFHVTFPLVQIFPFIKSFPDCGGEGWGVSGINKIPSSSYSSKPSFPGVLPWSLLHASH